MAGSARAFGLDQVTGAVWAANGQLHVIGVDGSVARFGTDGGNPVLLLPGQEDSGLGALSKLTSDGRFAIRANERGVEMTDLASKGRRQIDLTSPALAVEFLGTDRLAIGRQDGILEIRDLFSGAVVNTLNVDARNVDALAMTPGTVVSIGLDGDMSVLESASNEVIGRIRLPPLSSSGIGTTAATATAVALTADGMTLVTATSGGEVLLWTLDPAAQTSIACRTANHDLSAADWASLVGVDLPLDLRCTR